MISANHWRTAGQASGTVKKKVDPFPETRGPIPRELIQLGGGCVHKDLFFAYFGWRQGFWTQLMIQVGKRERARKVDNLQPYAN